MKGRGSQEGAYWTDELPFLLELRLVQTLPWRGGTLLGNGGQLRIEKINPQPHTQKKGQAEHLSKPLQRAIVSAIRF